MTKSEKSKFKYGIGEYKVSNEIGDRLVEFAASVILMTQKSLTSRLPESSQIS